MTDEPRIPELRRDPLSGRWVALAPWRATRPGAVRHERAPVSDEDLAACPFCEGREGQTPPETFALGSPGREPDTPGWIVRVVPNLYPAFEHHEVVIHTPRHTRSLADLTDADAQSVAAAWRARAGAARAAGFAYLQVVVNEGREAGGSRDHAHSQLVWLAEEPPVPAVEHATPCAVCTVLASAETIESRDGITLAVPQAGRGSYELIVAPRQHEPDAFTSRLGAAVALLASGVRRLHAVEGVVPLNAWIHTAPFEADGHWHIELLPRLSIIASLELGAGIYINSLAPEEAAARLRAAM